jgi:monoamine oxidase
MNVVVGAGAAGIAAARTLKAAGQDVVVLEASNTVGGRCITDDETFDYPVDRGGAWLHSASVNPLAPLAIAQGFTVREDRRRDVGAVVVEGRRLRGPEIDAYQDAFRRTLQIHVDHAVATPDLPLAALLPDSPWRDYARYAIALMTSVDAEQCSSVDYSRFDEAPGEWLLAEGLGTLIARLAEGLPVRLNSPVDRIDWSGCHVRLHTPRGTWRARRAIVTVPTSVLGSERLQITPALPAAHREALAGLPLGLLNKVALQVRPESPLGTSDVPLAYHASISDGILMRPGYAGKPMLIAFVGGDCADRLEQAGPGAATDFCFESLRAIYGNDIMRDVVKADETAWRANPWSLGAYSAALPGHADARQALAVPLAGTVYFAGEATHPRLYATVGGAWASGVRAATEAMAEQR